jgi:WD40 repeat protein
VWNLDTGATQSFELPRADTSTITRYKGYLDNVQNLWFTDESTLVTVGATHFLRWDLNDGSYETVLPVDPVMYREAAASQDGQRVLMLEVPFDGSDEDVCDTPTLYDLAAGSFRELPQFGDCVRAMALDTTGTVAVTGDNSGFIRVGRLDGAAPHLLTGHDGAVEYVAISSDLRWVASVGADTTVRLWPMPDLSKPPLHTLPHDELIAKLKSLTNLRAVRDEESSTGWKIEVGPFPGWAEVPEW